MGAEQIAGLLNLGAAGAVIAIVIIFLKYMRERDVSQQEKDKIARDSYDHRDEMWKEFFRNLSVTNVEHAQNVNKVLGNLVNTVEALKEEVKGMRSDLYLHDVRVDRIVEVVKDPTGNADSILPGRKKKEPTQ